MGVFDSTKDAMMRPVGPLPLVGWVGIAGVSFALYRAIKGHGATVPTASSGGGTGTSSGSGGGGASGGGSNYPPMTVQPGSSVYDPGSGGISTAPGISANDLLGGSVTDFVKSLGPNYSSFSFTSGNTGVNTTNSAQNIVDAQNYANMLQAQTQQHIADLGAQSDWLHTWTDYITNLWKLQHPTGQAAA